MSINMTAAMLIFAMVVASDAATNNKSRVSATQAASRPVSNRDDLRWQALALVESGACDDCKGKAGEISSYQMLKRVWRENTNLPFSAAANPFTALAVAEQEQARRLRHRVASDHDWFLTWHCPAHVRRPSADERAYAARCLNVLEDLKRKFEPCK